MRSRPTLALLLLLALAPPAAMAAGRMRIDPGPATITERERGIAADPQAGVEHAVVLVDETRIDDGYGTNSERTRHLRAKILSGEARRLADVEILLRPGDKITRWWGRVMLPDGTTRKLAESELAEQPLVRVADLEVRELRGALPGVVPGAVIDFGYTVKSEYAYKSMRVPVQGPWPVRTFRYQWRPSKGYPAAFRIYGAEGLDVDSSQTLSTITVAARDLPPVPDEPMMPPDREVRLYAVFYYLGQSDSLKRYWKQRARDLDADERPGWLGVVGEAVDAVRLDQDAELTARLEAAYEWIVFATENPAADRVFLQAARRLGAEAHVVEATHRNLGGWDPHLMTMDQFESTLVAVRAPDAPDDRAIVVDPSSGLPFGQIPWWISGTQGFLAAPDDPRGIWLPPDDAAANQRVCQGEIRTTLDPPALVAGWSCTSQGQAGLSEVNLVDRATERDEPVVERLCGAGPDVDVERAEHAVIFPPLGSRLDCAHTRHLAGPADVGGYDLRFGGPWFEPLPDLPPGPRIHPVVFDYPSVHVTEMTLAAPDGFEPGPTPARASIESPYGRYRLEFERGQDGFEVKRALALLPLKVPAAEYDALRTFLQRVGDADATELAFRRTAR